MLLMMGKHILGGRPWKLNGIYNQLRVSFMGKQFNDTNALEINIKLNKYIYWYEILYNTTII